MKNTIKNLDISLLKAIAVEPRAQIIKLLSSRSLCAGALARLLAITPGAVSQHLNVLKECGLVVAQRRGSFMHYRVVADARNRAREAVDTLFDNGCSLEQQKGKKNCTCSKHIPTDKKQ